ncbi:TFIIH complex serine/threonine-protein kinase subunit kin28 [Tulasnella sp. 408]|nr:TFIIH complex serine/threonine-protein kinase subunit kin28 [Tulasnella sp. 408]
MELNEKTMRSWVKEAKVGEGTYAVVYRGEEDWLPCRHALTGRPVAIKKIKIGQFKDGLDMSAIREVKYLRELQHPNVIEDLKPNNLLIASDGQLKIADFGLARDFADPNPGFKMTWQVITRWYRPPELLFGCRHYSTAVDMWSVGTIFAELMLRVPYMAGDSDLDQIKTIFRALGTPTEEEWPGHTKLPNYVNVGQFPKSPLNLLFTAASSEALDLLAKCFIYEPRRRITAKDGLHHPYFFTLPHPTHPSKLPKVAPTTKAKPLQVDDYEDDMQTEISARAFGARGSKRKASDVADDSDRRQPGPARRLDFS